MNHKAFTLIELLVVVLIIGILSAIALPQYSQAVEKSRAAEALSNIGSFKKAVEIWRLANPDKSRTFTGNGSGVGELDIDVPDNWVQGTAAMIPVASVPTLKSCSKNFCYDINTFEVKAYRTNSSTYKYMIKLYIEDGEYFCGAATSSDLKLCKSLSNINGVYDSL